MRYGIRCLNAVGNALNIGFAVLLVDRYGVLGLGVSFALAYLITATWSLQVLSYKVPGYPLWETLRSLYRMALAAAVVAEAGWAITHEVGGNVGAQAVLRLVVGAVVGVVVYVAALVVLKAPELDELRSQMGPSRRPAAAQ